ncbi:hypothetical protein Tco_0106115, partial [Tanacetum coccineum]
MLHDFVISSSSTVTYTSVYTNSEPGRVFWRADEELSNRGPEHPPSPNYVPGPEHPPSPVEVPYVPEPSDVEAPLEDQPLPADASPIALSPGYMADSDPDEDPEEDPEEDDDDDTDDDDEEPFEDEDDDEEEEEHLALADSSTVPVVDPVPSAEDESAPTPISPQSRIPFAQTRLRRARKTVKLEPPMSPSIKACIAEYAAAPTPPSSPL